MVVVVGEVGEAEEGKGKDGCGGMVRGDDEGGWAPLASSERCIGGATDAEEGSPAPAMAAAAAQPPQRRLPAHRLYRSHPHFRHRQPLQELHNSCNTRSRWPRRGARCGGRDPRVARRASASICSTSTAVRRFRRLCIRGSTPTTVCILAHLIAAWAHAGELEDHFHVSVGVQRPRR
uniref:Uncharacterized protein n=1 Tax=Oryza rufipogon TaxID=4529 RepID=A0A0E0QZ52_ORYRU